MTDWQPIETAPANQHILAAFQNGLGKWRIVGVSYYAAKTVEQSAESEWGEYDEERDTYWCPAGWYEHVEAETGLDYSAHHISENFTHWMPLPAPPHTEGEGR